MAEQLGFFAKNGYLLVPDALTLAEVELANEIYTPSDDQLAYAQRVVDAFEKAQGAGVVTVDGKMIDAPLITQQRRLLARAGRT